MFMTCGATPVVVSSPKRRSERKVADMRKGKGLDASNDDRESPLLGGEADEHDPEFDNWLNKELKAIYQSVLDEPIPEDMLRLIKPPN